MDGLQMSTGSLGSPWGCFCSPYTTVNERMILLTEELTGNLHLLSNFTCSFSSAHCLPSVLNSLTLLITWKNRPNFYLSARFVLCWLKPVIQQVNASIWQDVTHGHHEGVYSYCLCYYSFQSFPALKRKKYIY